MRWLLCASLVAALSGCRMYPVDVEGRLAERASYPVDVQPSESKKPMDMLPKPREETRAPRRGTLGPPLAQSEIVLMSAQQGAQPDKDKKYKSIVERLQVPVDLLGYRVPDIKVLPLTAPPKEREAQIKKQFPPLPALLKLPPPRPGPGGQAMALADLQQQALRGNPMIRQAHLDIAAARGAAVQAGLYPNPTVGYETDTLGQAGNTTPYRTAGQQGGFVEQVIKTAGKLKLAQLAALAEVQIAEQKLRQTENDVQTQVRTNYFALLSARKNFEVASSLAQLTDNVYNVLLLQFQAGEVAAYEPMQLRVLAMQSRGLVVQSYNRYIASWKQLAASLGSPTMPLTDVAGRIDMPVPHYEFDKVLEFVLNNHSDAIAARFSVVRDQHLLRLAQVLPIPDVSLHYLMAKDTTTPPFFMTHTIVVGMQVPIYNRNQGAIHQAEAFLQRSIQENLRVRNDLSSKVAEVFARYENNRILLDMYRKQMLPNQVQAFRAAVARHAAVGDKNVSYNDVVTVQQSLASLLNNYLIVLNDQWTAVTDIGALLQTKDLFQTERQDAVAPIPDVHELLPPRLLHRR